MRIVVWICLTIGRATARFITSVVAFYYVLASSQARNASKKYLHRIGLSSGFWNTFIHIRTFAYCVVDRIFFLAGQTERFKITRTGSHHLDALQAKGQGAILLGTHLGSFEALRTTKRIIHIVGYFHNAKKINKILQSVNKSNTVRLIDINPGSVDFILKIREIIEKGELVGILGDRIFPSSRTTEVEFLGDHATFPTGPFILASLVDCPIFLAFGLYLGDNRYDLHCEMFEERIHLPRGNRDLACKAYVQRFAQRIEYHCKQAPYNWFNFYDFWSA